MINRVLFLTAVFTAAVFLARAADEVGEVLALKGKAGAMREGKVIALAEGMSVNRGDVLETGPSSRLEILFRDDSRVIVGGASALAVDDLELQGSYRKNHLRLLGGKLRVIVERFFEGGHSHHEVQTETAVAGVKGTHYLIQLLPQEETLILTLQGKVAIETVRGRPKTFDLVAGEGIRLPFARGYRILRRDFFDEALGGFQELFDDESIRRYLALGYEQAGLPLVYRNYLAGIADVSPSAFASSKSEDIFEMLKPRPDQTIRHWGLRLGTRLDYLDEVLVLPEEGELIPALSNGGDFRIAGLVDAVFFLANTRRWEFALEYDLYQSFYLENEDFNRQGHSAALRLTRKGERVSAFAGYGVNEYLLGSNLEQFLLAHNVFGGLWIEESDPLYARISVRSQFKNFSLRTAGPDEDRDAFNQLLSLEQFYFWNHARSHVRLAYEFDDNDADGRNVSYRGHRFAATTLAGLKRGWALGGGYEYYDRDYPKNTIGRDDREHIVTVRVSKTFIAGPSVYFQYQALINNSTEPAFDFDRNMFTAGCDVTF